MAVRNGKSKLAKESEERREGEVQDHTPVKPALELRAKTFFPT